jgi:DNA-binding transcriptional ArsR family regulator
MSQKQETIQKSWWAAIWRGLVADPEAKHYRGMRSALWLYIYLIVHANRKTGDLSRRYETIARETGISKRTIRYWLSMLRREGYVEVDRSGHTTAINIRIQRWKPVTRSARKSDDS